MILGNWVSTLKAFPGKILWNVSVANSRTLVASSLSYPETGTIQRAEEYSAASLSTRGTRTHSEARVTSHAVHTSLFSQVWSTQTFLPFPPRLSCFVVLRPPADGMSSGSWSASFSVSALPDPLLSALRAAELDDPRVLCEYLKGTMKDLEMLLGETLGRDGAPSGAASSEQPSSISCNSSTAIPLNSSGTSSFLGGLVDSGVSVGGDPKTDPSLLCCCILGEIHGRRPKNRPSFLGRCILGDGRRPKDRPRFLQCTNNRCGRRDGRYLFSLSAGGACIPNCKNPFLLSRWVQNFAMNCRAVRKIQKFAMNSRVQELLGITCT